MMGSQIGFEASNNRFANNIYLQWQKYRRSPMTKWRKESILDIYNLVFGVLLFTSPWLLATTHAVMGEDAWVASGLIVSLSVAALMAFAEWEEWIILLLGIWLVVSPWILGFHHVTAMKINVGVGIVVAYLAGLELWLLHYSAPPTVESR
jgi:hypothetical protein